MSMALPVRRRTLTHIERDMIKSPRYVGRSVDIMPHYRRFPTLAEMTFTKVPNTQVTCTHCFGSRIQMVAHVNGLVTKEPCPICNKTGVMSNTQEAGK